jgi:O-antigen/teichoic acid export membrane protein
MNSAAQPTPLPVEVTTATPSLKKRAVHASAWTTVGFGFSQAFRFASNVLLTYLLVPEVFGLMMLVNIFLQGLQMFSDVGIGPAIIQRPRGKEPRYLDTAWTIQVMRGIALWIVACIIAYPVSQVWDQPLLAYLLPVAGLTAAIAGFNSTSLFTLNRDLTIAKLVLLDIGTQVVAVLVMVAWAWNDWGVWSILFGNIAGAWVKMIVSHQLVDGPPRRFAWDKSATEELFRFGRWIFLSTIITFFAAQTNNLLFGKLMGAARLGVYAIAFNMAQLGPNLVKKLGNTVGFPALADLYRRDFDRFRYRLRHMRLLLILPINAGQLAMAMGGPFFVDLIYRELYHDAGWMLTALAVNSLAGMVNSSYGNAHMAMGRTFRVMSVVAGQLVIMVPAALVGYYMAGEVGFLVGMASVQWLLYPVHMVLAIRAGIWQPEVDLPVMAVCGGIGFVCVYTYVPL